MKLVKHKLSLFLKGIENFFLFSNRKAAVYLPTFHNIPASEMERFKKLVGKLQEKYIFIDPNTFISFLKGDLELTNNHLLVTFDDGYYSNYSAAKEVLDPLGIKAIFFVSTGFIYSKSQAAQEQFYIRNICEGKNQSNLNDMKPMSWENLSELVDSGHIIGAHSKNHLRLSDIDSAHLLKEEIISSGDRIEEILGIKVEHFAFPFGDIGSISENAIKMAGTRYKYVYSSIRGRNSYGTSPLAIRREIVNISDDIAYDTIVAGGGLSFYYFRARRRLDGMLS